MNKTKFENFPYKEIESDIKLYTDDIKEQIAQAVTDCTKYGRAQAELYSARKNTDRMQKTNALTNLPSGFYKGSWKSTTTLKNGKVIGTFFNTTMVFTHYDKSYKIPLAPLLELGHKAKFPVKKYKRNKEKGIRIRRKLGAKLFVDPAPKGGHIEPALDKAREALDKKIKEILNK